MAEFHGSSAAGKRERFVGETADAPSARATNQVPMGRWLIEHTPRGSDQLVPAPRSSERSIPFIGRNR